MDLATDKRDLTKLYKNAVNAKALGATYDHLILDTSMQPREFSIRAPPDAHQCTLSGSREISHDSQNSPP